MRGDYRLLRLGGLGFLGLTLIFSPGICDRNLDNYSSPPPTRQVESLEGTVFPSTQASIGGCVGCHSADAEFKRLVEVREAEGRCGEPHPVVAYMSE